MAAVEDDGLEVVEGASILYLSTAIHGDRDEGVAPRVSVTEGVVGVEVERAAVVDRDGAASGSHVVLGIANDESAGIHDGRSGEGVCRREGRGSRSVLGECTRTGKRSAQGLVRGVAEDE